MFERWFECWIVRQWQHRGWWYVLMLPLSWLFNVLTSLRRWLYQANLLPKLFPQVILPCPVWVIGNINVGGVGKTPLIIALIEQQLALGQRVLLISRHYGVADSSYQGWVDVGSRASHVGDEAALVAYRLQAFLRANQLCIAVGRSRSQTAQWAYHAAVAEGFVPDIVMTDDGLQHYALARTQEWVVVNTQMGFGNGATFPAGSLREPISRLNEVQQIALHYPDGIAPANLRLLLAQLPSHVPVMRYQSLIQSAYLLSSSNPSREDEAMNTMMPLDAVFASRQTQSRRMIAVAGIGQPDRFFEQLRRFGHLDETIALPDHAIFNETLVQTWANKLVLMTEKDAVKCRELTMPQGCTVWVVPLVVF